MHMANKIGVGIIGAGPDDSNWAAEAHIPALRSLPAFEFRALSTTRRETAQAASRKYGVSLAFDNHEELVNRPDVDLVVVAVKVPYHLELVRAAVAARKHVFCEWPLGQGLNEALEMEQLVKDAGLKSFVGLQARARPELRYLRDLVKDGFVGQIFSSTLLGAGMLWGSAVSSAKAYTADVRMGATLLTIPVGHGADTFNWILGEFASLNATTAQLRKSSKVVDTGESISVTGPDQIAINGVLESGAVATIHYRGGVPRGYKLLWEINGSEGDLRLVGGGGHPGMFSVDLSGGRGNEQELQPLAVPEKYLTGTEHIPAGAPRSVASGYLDIASDLTHGTQRAPTFADAVVRHRLIDTIERSAATGHCESYLR
jgi:predicted dehydrogenase